MSHPPLYSSLPDVSSIGQSREDGVQKDRPHKSSESLNLHPAERPQSNPDISDGDDDIDLGELDSELDGQLELNYPTGDHTIPDCIVESVMSEDHSADELSVAFSESIGQRVKRERPSRTGFDRAETADLLKDTNQSDKENSKDKDAEEGEIVKLREEEREPRMFHFVGDWPSVGSLKQRQLRTRGSNTEMQVKETAEETIDDQKTNVSSGPHVTEFQKLLDLIQTGTVPVQTSSSHSNSISPSSGEEFEREDEAVGTFREAHTSRSSSEERQQSINTLDDGKVELPDCVLDGKAVDPCIDLDLRADNWEGIKIENEVSSIIECDDSKLENDRNAVFEDLKSTVLCHDDEVENPNIKDETSRDVDQNDSTENGREAGAEADSSHIGEVCQSPVCEGSVESESSGSSFERKQHQGRRSGKQCKLALTFTQNCPATPSNDLDFPNTTAENTDSAESSLTSAVKSVFNPDCCTNLDLKPDSDLFGESSPEAYLQLTSLDMVEKGCFTQTEPQDFALLWRLNHHNNSDGTAITVCGITRDTRIMYGDSSRFVPEVSAASIAVTAEPSGPVEVPYRVVHEKGTQVEEKELGETQDRLETLHILSRHFKLVSFDTLEDLYDKCHQDLEWTTNLLLDSGERFFKDEDTKEEEEEGDAADEEYITCSLDGPEAEETGKCPEVLDQHGEVEPDVEQPGAEDTAQQVTFGTVKKSTESANNTNISSFESPSVGVTNEVQSDATSDLQESQAELCLPKPVQEVEQSDNTEQNTISELNLDSGAWGGSHEEPGVQIEDEIASMDEINRLLQAELEEIEREGKQRKAEKWCRHLDIQTVELKLPTELALQLTELFGPVGVDPGN